MEFESQKIQGIPLGKSNLKRISFYVVFFLLLSKLIITDIGLRQLTQSKQINQHCGFDYL